MRMRAGLVIAVLMLAVGPAAAQQDILKDRQVAMKELGRNVGGVLSPMVRGNNPYDQAAVDGALAKLDEVAKKIPALFPDSSKGAKISGGEYSSAPAVWDNKAGFEAETAKFQKAVTDARGSVKDLDSLKAAMPAIGRSCSGCHEGFRIKG